MQIITSYIRGNDKNTMFYRYDMSNNGHRLCEFWFEQEISTGNIYSVYVGLDGRYDNFEIQVRCKPNDIKGYYPSEFTLRPNSYKMTVEESYEFCDKVSEVSNILAELRHFFEFTTHYDYYQIRQNKLSSLIDED